MEMKAAATTCMHWSQQVGSQSPSQALASSIPSPNRRNRKNETAIVCHFVNRSSLFGTTTTTSKSKSKSKLLRTTSCEIPRTRSGTLRRAVSASLDGFSDEEFEENIRELAFRFLSEDESTDSDSDSRNKQGESSSEFNFNTDFNNNNNTGLVQNSTTQFSYSRMESKQPPWLRIRPEPPYAILPASIERKANSVDLPLSLRLIKKKNQWTEEFRDAGESAYSSVKKAFSSMVFIFNELHSYTLQMREFLFFEDVQGILDRVQKEMNASFVWLFQQIFSHTPTLMMYVMILLANFTVFSISCNSALAAPPSVVQTVETETVSSFEYQKQNPHLDSSQIKTFSGKTISVGGNSGGGGKAKPVASGTDGNDGQFNGVSSIHHHIIVPDDELSQVSSFGNPTANKEETQSTQQASVDEEISIWNTIVEEASKMQSALMDESLDHVTMQRFVSPIFAEIEPEDFTDYSTTELNYQRAISLDPNNPLLLSNYGQFLYLVVHDHNRAEDYFKRASQAKPSDGEALSRYASFLWMARKNVDAAEETYLEAIEADPGNAYHAANYAHFLWNTGGEDTCYYPPGS